MCSTPFPSRFDPSQRRPRLAPAVGDGFEQDKISRRGVFFRFVPRAAPGSRQGEVDLIDYPFDQVEIAQRARPATVAIWARRDRRHRALRG